MRVFKNLAILLVMIASLAGSAFAQGPIQKRVNFTINVPYRLRMQNYVLPSGTYILYQISRNQPDLFALYESDMMHSPIAMIQTVRIEYMAGRYPDKTAIHWRMNELDSRANPVVTGWDIPGFDGWQIISVVPSHRGRNLLTRVR